MAKLWGQTYTRRELLRRVGDMSQVAAATPFELVDGNQRGVRGVRLLNAAGLEMRVITERGLAITELSVHGVPIPQISAVGTVHPAYAEFRGKEWLRTWPVGFLTPCGLTQAGATNVDKGVELGLHGRVFGLPARSVSWGGHWQGEEYVVWVEGTVRETAVFGENVAMTRRIWMRLDEPRFWVEDRIRNDGFEPSPLMFLQHINLGFPLLDAGSVLELGEHTTRPRDAVAEPGLADCLRFSPPVAGYQEQVFYHDLTPDAQGLVTARLVNPGLGGHGLSMYLRYARAEYPILVEWKMVGEGLYVLGLEPSNCHVAGRAQERAGGTLQMLAPQEERTFKLEIGFE
jgi:hypothetical protein